MMEKNHRAKRNSYERTGADAIWWIFDAGPCEFIHCAGAYVEVAHFLERNPAWPLRNRESSSRVDHSPAGDSVSEEE